MTQFHSSQDIMNAVFDSSSGQLRTTNVGGTGGKVQDVRVNGTSVLNESTGIADVNAITGIKVGGVTQTPVDGVVDIFPEPPTPTYGNAWGVLIPTTSETALVKVELADGVLTAVQSFSNTNFSEWVGCVYDISTKTVKYYLDPEDWSKKYLGTYHEVSSDGSASDLTGTDGDVVVEIPKTYSLYGTVASGDYSGYTFVLFGATAFQFQNSTATADNAFMVGSNSETLPKSYVYHAAYEGVLCNSSGEVIEVGDPPSWSDGYKIRSISGGKVFTNANQAIMELGYRNAGWHGSNWAIETFIAKAMMIYYGTRDLQSSQMGVGFAYSSTWNYSFTRRTGRGNSLGNGCGPIAFDSTLDSSITWVSGADATMKKVGTKFLGIENPYGHIWKFQFGLYKDSNTTYRYTLNPDEHPTTTATLTAADSGQVMYSNSINFNWPTSSGIYIKNVDFHAVLPTEVGGSSSTYYCDYYWYQSGPRCVLRGGRLDDGAYVGPFSLTAINPVSYADAAVGGFGSL